MNEIQEAIMLGATEIHKLREENKRLNNIIKTLEKYVIDEQISEYGDTLEEAKEFLEKLKRS